MVEIVAKELFNGRGINYYFSDICQPLFEKIERLSDNELSEEAEESIINSLMEAIDLHRLEVKKIDRTKPEIRKINKVNRENNRLIDLDIVAFKIILSLNAKAEICNFAPMSKLNLLAKGIPDGNNLIFNVYVYNNEEPENVKAIIQDNIDLLKQWINFINVDIDKFYEEVVHRLKALIRKRREHRIAINSLRMKMDFTLD